MLKHYLDELPDTINFEKYTLSNGLTVVLAPVKKVFSVRANLFVKVGSQYENKNINGISHFLEHMVFKGTESKPNHTLLVKDIDDNGGQQNASTSYEATCFYANIGFEYLNYVLEFLSDIFTNCIFPEEEFKKEKGVIIEEIRMYEDNPRYKVEDLLIKSMYGDQPAGWNIAGEEKNIQQMARNQMVQYYNQYYNPKNAILFIVGNFDKTKTKNLISRLFNKKIPSKKISYPKSKILFNGPQVNLFNKDIQETHFMLGFNTFPAYDKRNYVLSTIDNVLSSGFNSKLWLNIRERLGGTYYMGSSNDTMYDRGVFQLFGGVNNERSEEILTEVIQELHRLKTQKIDNVELEKVKNRSISNTLMWFDDPYYWVSPIYNAIFYNHKIETHKEYLQKLLNVTSNDIMKISNEIFTPKNIKLGILTKGYKAEQFKKIISKI